MSSDILKKANSQVIFRLGPIQVTPKLLQKASPYFFLAPAILILFAVLIFPVVYGLSLSMYRWTLRDMASSMTPKLTNESFEILEEEGLPEEVLTDLKKMRNRRFRTEDKFFDKVEQFAGQETVDQYGSTILDAALKDPEFIGFGNYRELFQSEFFWTSVKVTLKFTISVAVAEILLGLLFALLLEEKMKGLRIFRTIFILPIMIAPVVVGLVWKFLYDPSFGMINYFLGFLGIEPQTWLSDPDLALKCIIFTDIWQWTPFVFLLLLAGLQGIPRSLLEAGRVDGTTYLQNLIYIKLPLLKSIIGITAILRMIDAFRSLVVIFIMTEGGPGMSTELLSLHIYKTAFTSQRLGQASAVMVILLALILSLSIIIQYATRTEEVR